MNKTVTINIAGIIFHIDEDAYSHLQNYLGEIKGYFKNSDGQDEIMADIEARIAELFNEKLQDSKQVVSMDDVEDVIATMGQASDFAQDEEAEEGHSEPNTESNKRWNSGKRVFRDPDGKMLGGVSAGLSAYFSIDPIWFRLFFVLSTIFGGFGILIYIIMWIVIPEAKSTAEKLAMQGEPINVSNIGRKIEEEMEDFGERMGNYADDVGSGQKRRRERHFRRGDSHRNFFERMVELFAAAIIFFVKFFVRFLGVIFIIAATVLIIIFLSGAISYSSSHSYIPSWEFLDILFTSKDQLLLGCIGLFLILGIPVIGLFIAGFRMVFNYKNRVRGVGMGLVISWIAGIIICGIMALSTSFEYTSRRTVAETIELDSLNSDTLYLDLANFPIEEEKDHHYHGIRHSRDFDLFNLIRIEDSTIFYANAKMDIKKSKTDQFHLEVYKRASGNNRSEALNRAEDIHFNFKQKDSLLLFSPFYQTPIENKFRAQTVEYILYVPEGKVVYLADEMVRIIDDIKNTTRTWDSHMVGKKWIMTKEGLTCYQCPEIESKSSYEILEDEIEMEVEDALKDALGEVERELLKLGELEMELSTDPSDLDRRDHKSSYYLHRARKQLKKATHKTQEMSEEICREMQKYVKNCHCG